MIRMRVTAARRFAGLLSTTSLAFLCWAATVAVARAQPDPAPVIDSTCSYEQVMSALRAEAPVAALQLDSSAIAQTFLRGFLASPPEQRRAIVADLQGRPESGPYVGVVLQVANTCQNY